ncbi:hypothetical protein [Sphingomonas sp. LT1P40]|uniref:hypothetical protein n=1 Tax=Alteristakelama amylovorans TaxID=3096166 RepID=UPI002FCB0617
MKHPRLTVAAILLTVAIVLRAPQFGNPIAGLDEQYYLLVGTRIWDGAIPYVDLWDRKPAGLFGLFALIAALPGNGIVAAQIVATLFAAATAFTVALIARRWAGWVPATMVGIFYLAGLNELWGETTQTPVFYNLPLALAALLTLSAPDPTEPAQRRRAIAAMLHAGVAIQLKTNAVFEGAFFGIWLLVQAWHSTRSPVAVARVAMPLLIAGATPTLIAITIFAALGHFDAWWQANILSVLAKGASQDAAAFAHLRDTLVLTAPIVLLALLGLWSRTKRFTVWPPETAFLLGWCAIAIIDLIAIGGYFPHYALPLLLAASPLIAHAFAIRRVGPILFVLAMLWPLAHAAINLRIAATDRANAATVLAALPADVSTQCLYIHEGPVAYYQLTDACLATRYAFTAHLSSSRESRSLGVDPQTELSAIAARRPGTILTLSGSTWIDRNLTAEATLLSAIRPHYRPVACLPHHHHEPDARLVVWRRNDLAGSTATINPSCNG